MGEAAKKEPEIDPEKEIDTATGDNDNNTVELHDGTKVDVHKCKIRHAAVVARTINTVLIGLGIKNLDGVVEVDLTNPQLLLTAFEISSDHIVESLDNLSSLSRAEVEELDLDDGILLLAKVVEVNRDFFLNRVQKALGKLMPQNETSQQTTTAAENPQT